MLAIDTAEVEIASLQGGREYQQDAAYWTRERGCLVAAVADGMGSGKDSGRIACGYWRGGVKVTDPVVRADIRTSLADARTALCIAQGVPVDEIDPASGYDLSRRAYEDVRLSWRRHVEMHGFSEEYDRPRLESAVAWWAARRPDFTAGDDWLAGIHKPQTEGN